MPIGVEPSVDSSRWGGDGARAHRDEARGLLARDAARLLDDPPRPPARWASARFAREVEAVRRHLGPIATTASLEASFGQEAFHRRPSRPPTIGHANAVRIAYAIRWIELMADIHLPAWPQWRGEIPLPASAPSRHTPPRTTGPGAGYAA